jgi:hypothetical protein
MGNGRPPFRSILCVAAAALVSILTLAFAAQPKAGQKAQNPHWKADTCATCHTIDDAGKAVPIPPARVDAVCLKCHDGTNATKEMHPVGIPALAAATTRPADWPLLGEKLGCITCHEAKIACDMPLTKPNVRPHSNRPFLRGRAVPPKLPGKPAVKPQPFCQTCHIQESYVRDNPHRMIDIDPFGKANILDAKCATCHEPAVERTPLVRTGKPMLKHNELSLCRDCHPQHQDATMTGHIGKKLTPEKLAYMYAREVTGLSSQPSDQLLKKLVEEKRRPTQMIPDANDTITCSTCHNPHPAGAFPRDSALTNRPMRVTNDGATTSPVRGKNWCRNCHGDT